MLTYALDHAGVSNDSLPVSIESLNQTSLHILARQFCVVVVVVVL